MEETAKGPLMPGAAKAKKTKGPPEKKLNGMMATDAPQAAPNPVKKPKKKKAKTTGAESGGVTVCRCPGRRPLLSVCVM